MAATSRWCAANPPRPAPPRPAPPRPAPPRPAPPRPATAPPRHSPRLTVCLRSPAQLQDVVRISVEASAVSTMPLALEALKKVLDFTRAKDRISGLDTAFDPATIGAHRRRCARCALPLHAPPSASAHPAAAAPPGGYRDVMLNAVIDGHVCEIQLHLDAFLEIKSSPIGHAVYKYARALRGFEQERVRRARPLPPPPSPPPPPTPRHTRTSQARIGGRAAHRACGAAGTMAR